MSGESTNYSTPWYQLLRQLMMFIFMFITLILSISMEALQGILNTKMDDIIKNNVTKT